MRLKVYTAASVTQAMDRIREELGDDAVIVAVDEAGGKARVTVASDVPRRAAALPDADVAPPAPLPPRQSHDAAHLRAILRYHGIPSAIARQVETLADRHGDDGAHEAAGQALAACIQTLPVELAPDAPVLLAGTPGQGKTLAAARLATAARLAGHEAHVITLDGAASGATEQLRAFCAPSGTGVTAAGDMAALKSAQAAARGKAVIIDTAGLNPYALEDVEQLAHVIRHAVAEPVWVMAAGIDSLEAADMADMFASMGARRMIATRLDASRRLGALLTAPIKAGLALAGFSTSPYLADLIEPATPFRLAQFLLDKPDPAHIARTRAQENRAPARPTSSPQAMRHAS